jgi:uncharacterized small protein (TIGR04563 family)
MCTLSGSDKRKQSLYFPEDMLKEIQDEAARQDRSLVIVQRLEDRAQGDHEYPSVNEFPARTIPARTLIRALGAAASPCDGTLFYEDEDRGSRRR